MKRTLNILAVLLTAAACNPLLLADDEKVPETPTPENAAPAKTPAPAAAPAPEKAAPAETPAPAPAENTAPAPAANASAVTEELQAAADKFNASDFAGALEALQKVCAAHTELAPARIFMAQWFAQANVPQGVTLSLESATAENPDDPEAFLLLGEIALRQGNLTAAQLLLERGNTLADSGKLNAERKKALKLLALRNLAAIAEIRSDWNGMMNYTSQQIQLSGETAVLLRQKAAVLFQQKKEAEAQTLFEKADTLPAAENAPSGMPADAAMAQLYMLRGDMENARKSLAAALEKNPKSPETLALAVRVRMNEDAIDEAKALAERLQAETPDSVEVKRLRGTIALYLSEWLEAEGIFQELVAASPADVISSNGLALALCEQGDDAKLKRALEYAAQNVRSDAQNPELLGTLAWVLYKAKAYEQCAKFLQQATASGQINAANAYYLARLALQNGKTKEAVEFLQAAVSSVAPFAKRKEARVLLSELQK